MSSVPLISLHTPQLGHIEIEQKEKGDPRFFVVRQKIQIAGMKRVIEMCRMMFYGFLTVLSLGLWKKPKELFNHAWKRCQLQEHHAEIDITFLKTKKMIKGDVEDVNGLHDLLRKNRDFVLKIVKQSGLAIEHIDKSLQKDEEVARTAAENDILVLGYIDDSLKKNKSFMLPFIKRCGQALRYADATLQANEEVGLASIENNPLALEHCSPELKKKEKFVLEVLKRLGSAFQYADDTLKKNKDFILQAVVFSSFVLPYIDKSLWEDRKFVAQLLRKNSYAFIHLPPHLRDDKYFAWLAVRRHGLLLRWAGPNVKKDKNIALVAIKRHASAARYVAPELLVTDAIRSAIIHQDYSSRVMQITNEFKEVISHSPILMRMNEQRLKEIKERGVKSGVQE